MAEENTVDEFLAHYGVPGMKWGKRQAGETKESRKAANKETLRKAGEERIAKAGGSANKAIAASVGKAFASNFVLNVGANQIGRATKSPAVAIGAAVVGTAAWGVAMGKTINEIRAVNEAVRSQRPAS